MKSKLDDILEVIARIFIIIIIPVALFLLIYACVLLFNYPDTINQIQQTPIYVPIIID